MSKEFDFERLDELLSQVPEKYCSMSPDILDGFLTAIALMKSPPHITDWLPFVCDMENGDPQVLMSMKRTGAQLRNMVLERGKAIEDAILHQTPISPVIYVEEDFDDELEQDNQIEELDRYEPIRPFSLGFSMACSLWPELLHYNDKSIKAALVGILRYEPNDQEDSEKLEQELSDAVEEEVPFANYQEALEDIEACIGEIAVITRGQEINEISRQNKH